MEPALNTGEVDAIVLHAGVVAHDQEAELGETKGEAWKAMKARLSQMRRSPAVRALIKSWSKRKPT
jgi:hypothetical protein